MTGVPLRLILGLAALFPLAGTRAAPLSDYNVVWDSPSKDHNGSMPLGNGDISLNAWIEPSGDLIFYIGKTDSWGDNARLLKIGRVRVSLTPNPFKDSKEFKQTLKLNEGAIEVRYGDSIQLKVWVDANHPVVHVVADGKEPLVATATIEPWRNEPYELPSVECSDTYLHRGLKSKRFAPTIVEPDVILKNQNGRIGWYHYNKKSVGPEFVNKLQGLGDYKMLDPILHRTFGAVITAENASRKDDLTLTTRPSTSQQLNIYVLTEHPSSPDRWLDSMDKLIDSTEKIPFQKRREAHKKWWGDFWNRSWIYASQGKIIAQYAEDKDSDATILTRAYILQRFINACGGRGAYPIKFNGSIFTVPSSGKPGDADYRRWGGGYWWQNTRLPYISMCASGDYDLMKSLFEMYTGEIFKLSKYRTRLYFNHAGAYFPEVINFWGACPPTVYGWTPTFGKRKDKLQTHISHKWEWVSGPELVYMMLDYYEHTRDERFLKEKILPVAREVMLFFENYYKEDQNGKLVMYPSQALEGWLKVTNPMPEIAGLRAISRRILELPDRLLTRKDRAYWKTARNKLPEIPVAEKKGVRMLVAAEKLSARSHGGTENPELYAVFPFRQIAVGKPNIELGLNALKHRGPRGSSGWRQEDIFMAYLGLADQARKNLVARAKKKHAGSRFPAFWGPNHDWIPDQDHGGVLLKAFQSMLMQTEGRAIYLLPAWPRDWDADFKLHAPFNTTVRGKVVDGELRDLEVTPAERRKDLVIMKPQ